MKTTPIRRATARDLDELVDLWRDGHASRPDLLLPRATLRRAFSTDLARCGRRGLFGFWVFERQARIEGFVALQRCRNHPFVASRTAEFSIYVRSDRRGRSVGRALIRFACEHADRNRAEHLLGWASEGSGGELLGKKFGFVRLGKLEPSKIRAFPSPLVLTVRSYLASPRRAHDTR